MTGWEPTSITTIWDLHDGNDPPKIGERFIVRRETVECFPNGEVIRTIHAVDLIAAGRVERRAFDDEETP